MDCFCDVLPSVEAEDMEKVELVKPASDHLKATYRAVKQAQHSSLDSQSLKDGSSTSSEEVKPPHVHIIDNRAERKQAEDTLKRFLALMHRERRKCRSALQWKDRLRELPVADQATWLYYNPEEIRPEWQDSETRRGKNPWQKHKSEVVFDLDIFTRDATTHPLERTYSPGGTEYIEPQCPLPAGASSWNDVQGRASPPEATSAATLRALKCHVAGLAYTHRGIKIRQKIGSFLDMHNIRWPASLRFSKAVEQWSPTSFDYRPIV